MALSRSESPIELSTVTTSELGLGDQIGEVARREKRILVEDDGEPVAVIVSLADLRDIQTMQRNRVEARERLDRISAAFDDLSEGEIDAMVEEAIEEVDAIRRERRNAAAE